MSGTSVDANGVIVQIKLRLRFYANLYLSSMRYVNIVT